MATSGPTVIAPRDIDFSGDPCPRCLGLSMGGHVWPEMVMPLPLDIGEAPLARDGSGPCCHDCASADSLFRCVALMEQPNKHRSLAATASYDRDWFLMARIAVGNDRIEQLRLPGAPMGLVYFGLMAPSKPGDLEQHLDWLDSLPYFARDTEDDDLMPTPMSEALALQKTVNAAKSGVAAEKADALRAFEELKAKLTMDELLRLAENCGEEVGPKHCIFCAAWDEYVKRGGND